MAVGLTDDQFQAAFKFDLDHEGRIYENVPGDSGGPTRWGVTWQDGNEWRLRNGMQAMTEAQAAACQLNYLVPVVIESIYKAKYYDVFDPSALGGIVTEVLFDCAVNTGVKQSVLEAQRECGITDDGVWGPNTEQAILAYIATHGKRQLCQALIHRRVCFYDAVVAAHPNDEEFIKGWLQRCADIMDAVNVAVPV